jgi:hypothetical protein
MTKRKKKRANSKSQRGKLQQFARNMKRDGTLGNNKLIFNPAGEVKMSDVLGQVIEPYLEELETLDAYRTLVTAGAMAWNNTLLPPEGQAAGFTAIDGLDIPAKNKEIMKELIMTLMKRKQALFPDIRRFIISYEVSDLGNQWHLSVASTIGTGETPS